MTAKHVLISMVLFLITSNSFGQKINYQDIKNDFSTKNYNQKIDNPTYSPLAAGICNYFLPGLGHVYIQEPLRGACFFGGAMITSSITLVGLFGSMENDSESRTYPINGRRLMISGLIGTGIISVWSIYDVVKVTKIKNLASQRKNISFNIKPNLNYFEPVRGRKNNTYGLTLSANF